ncbi:MAG: isocitrate lyase/PEP mutase family protein [Bacteroidota bacterium]
MDSFKELHSQKSCLIIGNAWDAMSALVMEQAGFRAIGTTSWGIANSLGYKDGEIIDFKQLVSVIEKILKVVNIPVSVDIESGYSEKIDEIVANVLVLARMGCAGINIEDSIPDHGLKEKKSYADVVYKIKQTLLSEGFSDFFVNARIDTYLQLDNPLEETIARAKLYESVGADGVFVPCMSEISDVKQLLSEINVPLNLMSLPNLTDINKLTIIGVKRFSYGNAMSDAVIACIEEFSKEILSTQKTDCLYKHGSLTSLFVAK